MARDIPVADRVAVMHKGRVEQFDHPQAIYERPASLFVAGFVGSPAMNFFPGTLTDTGLRLPFGEVALEQSVRQVIGRHPGSHGEVVVGVRPEHLGDAALMDDGQRAAALTFEARVDLVESLGADKYVYFTSAESAGPNAVPADAELVARVPAESKAAGGQPIRLALPRPQSDHKFHRKALC